MSQETNKTIGNALIDSTVLSAIKAGKEFEIVYTDDV
jgi:hypothetical protein